MKYFFILIIIFLGIFVFLASLPDPEPDKPSLFIYKTPCNGKKIACVAFRANKKSPWREVYCPYKGAKKEKKEIYQFALIFMCSSSFMATFDGSEEEWELMYNTIEKEVND